MKMAGIILLFGACMLTGWEIIAGWKRCLRTTEALLALVIRIAEEIDGFSAPLGEIYSGCRDELLLRYGFPHPRIPAKSYGLYRHRPSVW